VKYIQSDCGNRLLIQNALFLRNVFGKVHDLAFGKSESIFANSNLALLIIQFEFLQHLAVLNLFFTKRFSAAKKNKHKGLSVTSNKQIGLEKNLLYC
jgi:hypothetical protein